MDNYHETSSGVLVPNRYKDQSQPKAQNNVRTRGQGRRLSLDEPQRGDAISGFHRLYPSERGFWLNQRIDPDRLALEPAQTIIDTVKTNDPNVQQAVRYIKRLGNQDFLIASDDLDDNGNKTDEGLEAENVIQDVLMQMESESQSFDTKCDQSFESYYTDGGIIAELTTPQRARARRRAGATPTASNYNMDVFSPFTLEFEEAMSERKGRYYRIGQRQGGRFVLLQDEEDSNQYIRYEPNGKVLGKPYGQSELISAIFGVLSSHKIQELFVRYFEGQALPRGLVSIDTDTMVRAGFDKEDINDAAVEATNELRAVLSGTQGAQTTVLSTPIQYELIGSAQRRNVDGVEMLLRLIAESLQRALGLPSILQGGRREASLNDTGARVEWSAYQKSLSHIRRVVERVFNHFFKVILTERGIAANVKVFFDETDEEGARYAAERLGMDVPSYSMLIADGVLSRQEVREVLLKSYPRFKDLPTAIPEDTIVQAVEESIPPTRSKWDITQNNTTGKGILKRIQHRGRYITMEGVLAA